MHMSVVMRELTSGILRHCRVLYFSWDMPTFEPKTSAMARKTFSFPIQYVPQTIRARGFRVTASKAVLMANWIASC